MLIDVPGGVCPGDCESDRVLGLRDGLSGSPQQRTRSNKGWRGVNWTDLSVSGCSPGGRAEEVAGVADAVESGG